MRNRMIAGIATVALGAALAGAQAMPHNFSLYTDKKAKRAEDVITVLSSEAKKRREAAEAFAAGDRQELADKEKAESEILAEYLPAQMSADEIAAVVTAAVESAGAAGEGMKAMGKVMGIVSPQVKGKADGGTVAAEVKRQLGA